MAGQRLLFLGEGRIASVLELLRRILQPTSRSLPHITLRYSSRPLKESAAHLYQAIDVRELVIDRPATFDDTDGIELSTLILLCDSEQLEHLVYKPDFPQSFFHLTLYQGPPSELAGRALQALERLDWGLRYSGSLRVVSSSAEAVATSTVRLREGVWLTDGASELMAETADQLALAATVLDWSDEDRLRAIQYLAKELLAGSETDRAEPALGREFLQLKPDAGVGQLSFWTRADIGELNRSSGRDERVDLHATFATPPELAVDVAAAAGRYVASDSLVDFGDPAIGSGSLFAAARYALGEDRMNSARGVEIDEKGAERTLHRWRRSNLSVAVGDFLRMKPEASAWTLMLANPPYKRSQLLSPEFEVVREQLNSEVGLRLSARADLYAYFVLRADAWLAEEAIAAWIVPAEFQVADYAEPIRRYLTWHVELLRVHTYDTIDLQFDNALTTTSVVIYRKRAPRPDSRVRISQGGAIAAPRKALDLSSSVLRQKRRWSFDFLSDKGHPGISLRVGDLFTIKRGIATGANSWFVLDDEDLQRFNVDDRWVRPLIPRIREVPSGLIAADYAGNPVPSSGTWLIDTKDELAEIERRSPEFASYLRSLIAEVGARALVRRRFPPYAQEPRVPAPFYFAYMAKDQAPAQSRFVRNESRGVALNNMHSLHLRPPFASLVSADPSAWNRLDAALRDLPTAELAIQGRTYGHGLLKLEPKELAAVRFAPSEALDQWWRVINGTPDY